MKMRWLEDNTWLMNVLCGLHLCLKDLKIQKQLCWLSAGCLHAAATPGAIRMNFGKLCDPEDLSLCAKLFCFLFR